MIRKSIIILCLFFLGDILGLKLSICIGQMDPAELFDEYCADCHSIGEGDMKGPDLLGVELKYKEKWLIDFIRSAKTMIDAGDKLAVKTYEKYGKKNMPDTKLSDSEIKMLIDYIKSLNPVKASRTLLNPQFNNSNQNPGGKGQKNRDLDSEIEVYEEKLKNIEKKLDQILEFHKKSLSARITDAEINKGKELFNGERPFTNDAPPCVSCHNIDKIDTLNWNPSAYDISTTYSKGNNEDMSNLLINPISNKMKEVLLNNKLTDDETFYLTAYLQSIEKTGLNEPFKFHSKFIFFMLVILIMLSSLINMLYLKIIKSKLINFTLFFLSLLFVFYTLTVSAKNIGLSKNYAPDQPIKFSHKIHVKENKIECIFCHNSPEYSRESGVPTTNICLICHNKIKSGAQSGQFEISKIQNSIDKKKPIEWIKIHNLPDHVFFSHSQHVTVGKIDCITCHGEVSEMDITYQYASLSMGWCVECHRKSEVHFEENKYYSNHKEIHRDLKSGKISKVTADKIGANDCQKCHY